MSEVKHDALLEVTVAAACELVATRKTTRAVHIVSGNDSGAHTRQLVHDNAHHQDGISVVQENDGITILKRNPGAQGRVVRPFYRRTAWQRLLSFLIPF
jgi:hypothetical protein